MDIAEGMLMTLVVSVKAQLTQRLLTHVKSSSGNITAQPLTPTAKRVGNQHEIFVCISIGMMF